MGNSSLFLFSRLFSVNNFATNLPQFGDASLRHGRKRMHRYVTVDFGFASVNASVPSPFRVKIYCDITKTIVLEHQRHSRKYADRCILTDSGLNASVKPMHNIIADSLSEALWRKILVCKSSMTFVLCFKKIKPSIST